MYSTIVHCLQWAGLAWNSCKNLVLIDADFSNPRVIEYAQDGQLLCSQPFEELVPIKTHSKCRFIDVFKDNLIVADLGTKILGVCILPCTVYYDCTCLLLL